jgi:tol-pal system protein YbgF
MTYRPLRVALAVLLAATISVPAAAASREQLQLMADIRMLQEQAQQLQLLLGSLGEALKAVNTRIDQQAETNRRGFADQKLAGDSLSNDIRVVREKMDDNNVRVGSLTQEIDALRETVRQLTLPPATTAPFVIDPGTGLPVPVEAADPAPAATAAVPTPPPSAALGAGTSPSRLYSGAYSDYTAGQYELAAIGFESYVRSFPRSELTDDAQVYVGHSYLQAGKYDKAVEAYDLAIRTYPTGNMIPDAMYKRGVALKSLKQVDRAVEAFELVTTLYPTSDAALLAKQELGSLKR